MSLVRFKAENHPQQVARAGAKSHIDDRATTPEMFAGLHERFHFSIDVAASEHNAKLPRFFSLVENGLWQPWAGERVWCNPPYSDIRPWVEKAWAEVDAEIIVMILPANRTEQRWWQDLVEPHRDRPGSRLSVEFLRDRIRFLRPGSTAIAPNERPPFGSALLIWARAQSEYSTLGGEALTQHICVVCFRPSDEHEDREYWPPRCCHGCGCGETMDDETDWPQFARDTLAYERGEMTGEEYMARHGPPGLTPNPPTASGSDS